VFVDKSFSFETKTPPASYYIMKAAKLDKGAKTTGSEVVGAVTRKQLEEIAEIKMVDMNANDIDGAVNTLSGSARSMGIQVRG
jgi:large subunit ribosomal protein L11